MGLAAPQKKRHVWDVTNWLHESEKRTADFWAGRAAGPVTWVLVDGKNIPAEHAIVGGEEHGQPHYICRGWHEVSRSFGICKEAVDSCHPLSAIRVVSVSSLPQNLARKCKR